jgi:elongin-A
MKVAIENIHLITSLGNMPTEYVHAVLRAVKTSTQLHTLEVNSEDIYEETEEHWRRIVEKDFPILVAQHNWQPKNPMAWHKVWEKYKALQDQQDAEATAKLMQNFAAKREEKDARRPAILSMQESRRLPQLKPTSAAAGSRSWSSQPPREKQTFLQKARRQVAAESKRFKLSTPTGKLPVAAGQISKAPAAMLNEARIERQSGPAAIRVLAPRGKGPSAMNSRDQEIDRRRKENEARLLRIKNAATNKATATPNVVSFSDDEDDDFEDGAEHNNDLFGEMDDSFPQGGALSPGSLEEMGMSSSSSANRTTSLSRPTSKQPPKPTRRGLLSASPGVSTTVHRVSNFPQTSTDNRPPSNAPASSPPPSFSARPTAPPRATTLPTIPPNPAGPSSPPAQIYTKRKQVDVFMRPSKRPRR